MEVQSASENVMAKFFPLFLTDIAAMWIRQLETESISSWNMLVARFLEQFRVHIARPRNVMSLTTIKQRPRETLCSFLERFNVAAASVDRPEQSMVLMAAVSDVLDNTEFKKSLYRDPP